MEKYLEGEEFTVDEIKQLIRKATIANKMVPVTCGTSYKNKGVQKLLDAIVDYMPAPTDVPAIKGVNPDTEEEEDRHSSDNEPFAALAFKIATDPFVGKLCFFRVYSGTVDAGSPLFTTPSRGHTERMGRILQMHANHREDIETCLRRRHCRCGRSEEHHHRRYPVRRGASHYSGVHGVPGSRYPCCH